MQPLESQDEPCCDEKRLTFLKYYTLTSFLLLLLFNFPKRITGNLELFARLQTT